MLLIETEPRLFQLFCEYLHTTNHNLTGHSSKRIPLSNTASSSKTQAVNKGTSTLAMH